jgi:hypothetical protein
MKMQVNDFNMLHLLGNTIIWIRDLHSYWILSSYMTGGPQVLYENPNPLPLLGAYIIWPAPCLVEPHQDIIDASTPWHFRFIMRSSVQQPVAHQRVDLVITRAETPQLHLLAVLDLLCITVSPFNRHIRICVCIYQYIEGAVAIEYWKKRD